MAAWLLSRENFLPIHLLVIIWVQAVSAILWLPLMLLRLCFSEQSLLYPLLPYEWPCFFSKLWKGRVRWSGCSTCFCISNAFSVPLEKLSRSTLCYLGIKCRLMPSCEMLHFVTALWLLFRDVTFYSGRVWFEASCGMGVSFSHRLYTYRLQWDLVPMTL